MRLLDKIRSFLRPLPEQQVMDRGPEDRDTRLDPDNTLRDPGATYPNPSLKDDMEPPGTSPAN